MLSERLILVTLVSIDEPEMEGVQLVSVPFKRLKEAKKDRG